MQDLEESYKEAMSSWSSGVTIVTAHYERCLFGMTVSSFAGVSLDPAMISICINIQARLCPILEKSKKFAINILRFDQIELARIFSDHNLSMDKRFEFGKFDISTTQSPVLRDCLCWFDCAIENQYIVGDHILYIGKILKIKIIDCKNPLVYFKRNWHCLN